MTDIAQEFIDKGMASIQKTLGRAVDKGRLGAEERDATLARISTGLSYDAGADADLFIEAAPEIIDLKRQIFTQAVATLRDDAIIATNTSSLMVAELAAAAGVPERFIGIHFFNPVPVMALVR